MQLCDYFGIPENTLGHCRHCGFIDIPSITMPSPNNPSENLTAASTAASDAPTAVMHPPCQRGRQTILPTRTSMAFLIPICSPDRQYESYNTWLCGFDCRSYTTIKCMSKGEWTTEGGMHENTTINQPRHDRIHDWNKSL